MPQMTEQQIITLGHMAASLINLDVPSPSAQKALDYMLVMRNEMGLAREVGYWTNRYDTLHGCVPGGVGEVEEMQINLTFLAVRCGRCGVHFGMEREYYRSHKREKASWKSGIKFSKQKGRQNSDE